MSNSSGTYRCIQSHHRVVLPLVVVFGEVGPLLQCQFNLFCQ